MPAKKLLNQVLKRFNSLLFLTPEERETRQAKIANASPEGLAELLNVFEQAHEKQKKYLKILCESDPDFAKSFYTMIRKGETEMRAEKKLRGLKSKIKA